MVAISVKLSTSERPTVLSHAVSDIRLGRVAIELVDVDMMGDHAVPRWLVHDVVVRHGHTRSVTAVVEATFGQVETSTL